MVLTEIVQFEFIVKTYGCQIRQLGGRPVLNLCDTDIRFCVELRVGIEKENWWGKNPMFPVFLPLCFQFLLA